MAPKSSRRYARNPQPFKAGIDGRQKRIHASDPSARWPKFALSPYATEGCPFYTKGESKGALHVQRPGGQCLFCDLERLDECVHDGRGRTAIRQALQVFLKNDEDIFEEALARIGEVIPDFADLEEGARRLVAAGDWSRILAHRRRLRAEPVAEEDAVYRHRVDTDRQRVRKKFFPSKALVFLKELNAKIDDKAFNDSGLPAAHVTSTAAAIER
ncbi:pif1, partial [Symbiodinium pilosum]